VLAHDYGAAHLSSKYKDRIYRLFLAQASSEIIPYKNLNAVRLIKMRVQVREAGIRVPGKWNADPFAKKRISTRNNQKQSFLSTITI
jgi:hypothetical protein